MSVPPTPDDPPAESGSGSRPGLEAFAGTWPPNVHDVLGITVVELGPDRTIVEVPVDWRVHQPFGLLHGGVSALLAESAASMGAAAAAGPGRRVVGIELNCSHLRAVRDGTLRATATPVRKGRTVQVWEIRLTDELDREVCRARCTLAVSEAPPEARPESTPESSGP